MDDFVLRLELAFSKVLKYEPEVSMSDRMLALLTLYRLDISKSDRAQIVQYMKESGKFGPRQIVAAIRELFIDDVHAVTQPQRKTPKDDDLTIARQTFHVEDERTLDTESPVSIIFLILIRYSKKRMRLIW